MLLQAIEHSTVLICYRNIIDRWFHSLTKFCYISEYSENVL